MKKTKKIVSKSFNRKKIYDKEIVPVLNKIYALCKKHKIPMAIVLVHTVNRDDTQGDNWISFPKGVPQLSPSVLKAFKAVQDIV
jgi:hypothetical protein